METYNTMDVFNNNYADGMQQDEKEYILWLHWHRILENAN